MNHASVHVGIVKGGVEGEIIFSWHLDIGNDSLCLKTWVSYIGCDRLETYHPESFRFKQTLKSHWKFAVDSVKRTVRIVHAKLLQEHMFYKGPKD